MQGQSKGHHVPHWLPWPDAGSSLEALSKLGAALGLLCAIPTCLWLFLSWAFWRVLLMCSVKEMCKLRLERQRDGDTQCGRKHLPDALKLPSKNAQAGGPGDTSCTLTRKALCLHELQARSAAALPVSAGLLHSSTHSHSGSFRVMYHSLVQKDVELTVRKHHK